MLLLICISKTGLVRNVPAVGKIKNLITTTTPEINWHTNSSLTFESSATESTSRHLSYFSAGRTAIASIPEQPSKRISFNLEPSSSATASIARGVRREHLDKFIEVNDWATLTKFLTPTSVSL